ncbi:MAG: FtsW/RodA/SpoVE family cell cycle protein, partial [bacterium]
MQQRTLLFVTVVLLLSIGVVMIYSTSAFFAQDRFNDSYYFLKRQALWIMCGLAAFACAVNIDYHRLRNHSLLLFFASIALLAMVFVPGMGRTAGGASRWIWFGCFSFQPSEIAKFALILYLADVLARKQRQIDRFWKGLMMPLALCFLMLGLIIMQPDLGTTVLMALMLVVMLFVAGARLRLLLPLALAAPPAIYALVFSSDYRKRRIIA